MEKKNPYVMTIGFRRNNADHTRVAEFLNSLGREKAQYIVKAVLDFQLMEERGEVPTDAGAAYNYESIRRIVLQILKEQNASDKTFLEESESWEDLPSSEESAQTEEEPQEDNLLQGFDEDAMLGIMASISAFQENV
jgi:hypothetical protein